MKCNPKNSILQINAELCVYIELCYKHFTSKKNRIIILIFPMYPTYPLMEYVSSLKNEVDEKVPKEPMINIFLKTICKKYGANVLTLC